MARDKGSGSVYQRESDKRWFAQLTVDGRTKSKSSMKQAEVKKWLKDTIRDNHRGTFTAGKTPTVGAYFTEWIAGRDVAPRTRESYQTSLKRVLPYVGHIRLDKLTENHIKAMWQALRDGKDPDGKPRKPIAATSLRTTYTHVNTALSDAVKSKSIPLQFNPATDARPPRPEHKEMHPLTEEEVRRLLAATVDDPEYPIWLTLITTGLRVGELVGLKVDDLSADGTTLSVRRAAYRLKGQGIVEASTKTYRGRVVDLPPTTARILVEHIAGQKVRSIGGYVFTSESGIALDPARLGKRWHRALHKAGISPRKLHDTRHTYATLLFAKGEHPKVVQEQMGHASIKITLDTYSAYVPSMGRSAAERMETLFA